jgi:hypothetical protein
MIIWRIKSCPKCGGDMFFGREVDNIWYEQCLQCSYSYEVNSPVESKLQQVSVRAAVEGYPKMQRFTGGLRRS